jgi:hypothetical protein
MTRGGVRQAPLAILVVTLVTVALNLVTASVAGAAIVTSEATLSDGQLTIVGSGAVPFAGVTVDGGPVFGQADAQGDFTITASDFSEPSCVATLDDGSVTVEVTLSGCTPSVSPPPAVPLPPSVTGPAPGASTTEPVTLSWQPPVSSPGVSYRWQVSIKPTFASPVMTATTDPMIKSAVVSGLTPGTYYWRVQSVKFPPEPYPTTHGPWTSWRKLIVTGVAPGTPGAPGFLAPLAGAEYHPEETFPLSWTATTDSTSYRLQMASRANFAPGTLLVDETLGSTHASAPLFGFQTHLFVRVFGVNAQGVLSVPSTTLPLRITFRAPVPAAPTLLSPPDGATVSLPVVLDWTPDPNPQVEGYELEISRTTSFALGCGDIELCVTGLSQPRDKFFSLPSGVHFWRIQSSHGLAGRDTAAVTAWSQVRSFTVSSAPPAVESLRIDVFTGGGTFLRSHTDVFSGTTEDNEAFGIVQLTTPAPSGGETVDLTSSGSGVASVPSLIKVPGGQAQQSFKIDPKQVLDPTPVTLSAGLDGRTVSAPLTVDPPDVQQVDINTGPPIRPIFSGGTSEVGSLLFNGVPPTGRVIGLTSSSPAASVPSSLTISRSQSPDFQVATLQVTRTTAVVITASWKGQSIAVTMILQPPPLLFGPASGSSFSTGQRVTFRWQALGGLSSELQISSGRGFSAPFVDFDTDTETAWSFTSLPSGTLYWRVIGIDAYGVDGPPSSTGRFTVRPPNGPLPAPTLEAPADGSSVAAGQEVSFFWQVVNGAASYELQVSESSTFDPPAVLDKTIKTNELDTTKLPVAALFWRVRALDSEGPGAWSPVFQLTVTSS